MSEISAVNTRGVYKWYLYFDTRSEQFEITDYLRRLNKDAWKRWKNFDENLILPAALTAEPIDDLAPVTELKKRFEDSDRRLNESYQDAVRKVDQEQLESLRADQREWITPPVRAMGAWFSRGRSAL